MVLQLDVGCWRPECSKPGPVYWLMKLKVLTRNGNVSNESIDRIVWMIIVCLILLTLTKSDHDEGQLRPMLL